MSTLNNYLIQLQKLTQTNLDLLTGVNGALKGDSTSTKVEINGKTYDIPSFVALENKVNSLQETINNIVYAPNTGEALINMTGNSRIIEIRGYNHTPNSLILDVPKEFGVEENNIFKDFLTPIPYVRFDISAIPNDITSVNIKKIIPKTEKMLSLFTSTVYENSICKYATILRHIKTTAAQPGIDYIEYDSIKKLPIRKNIGQGEYIIKSIISDEIDDSLVEHITIQLHEGYVLPTGQENTMTYVRFDGTLETFLSVGDRLVTYDDGAKLEIEAVDTERKQLKLKVLYGEYLNLIGTNDYLSMDEPYQNISNVSKLKFFSPVNFDTDKYINVPLEEDKYVFIAIAPLNDRMNIQSGWGTGVLINTDNLKRTLTNNSIQTFKDYYKTSVKNIGDCLNELVSMLPGELTKFSKEEFETLMTLQPQSSHITAEVVQINKHLNDSPYVASIRNSHNNKIEAQIQIDKIQREINDNMLKMSKISLNDTTGIRANLLNELKTLNEQKNTYLTTLNNEILNINHIYNSNAVPSAAAKYHVRGYFNLKEFSTYLDGLGFNNITDKIRGIEVQYRYVNENPSDVQNTQTNVTSIGDSGFVYSEWEIMPTFMNEKIVSFNDGYKFNFKSDNSTSNEPSFNQIDIPISQGEKVELRLRVIYDYGYPFVKTYSNWSPIQSYKYPTMAQVDLTIGDIMAENKNDIALNNLQGLLKDNGVTSHVDDCVMDQDLTYFHKSDNIASGFYTAERRIIPLKDKLKELNDTVAQIYNEIKGDNVELDVQLNIGLSTFKLEPLRNNKILVDSYNQFDADANTIKEVNGYSVDKYKVIAPITISISNNSSNAAKLYSMFPGSKDAYLKDVKNSKYLKEDFVTTVGESSEEGGAFILSPGNSKAGGYSNMNALSQKQNQWVSFRIKSPWDGTLYYDNLGNAEKAMPYVVSDYESCLETTGSIVYPYSAVEDEFIISGSNKYTYLTINPNTSKTFQLFFEFDLHEKKITETSKTIAFDLRTSLYNDPITYEVTITAKDINTAQDKLMINMSKTQYNKYKTVASN